MAENVNTETPKRPSWETKHESTNRVARDIISKEAAAAAAKIERLREARLAQIAAQPPVKAKAVKPKAKPKAPKA